MRMFEGITSRRMSMGTGNGIMRGYERDDPDIKDVLEFLGLRRITPAGKLNTKDTVEMVYTVQAEYFSAMIRPNRLRNDEVRQTDGYDAPDHACKTGII
mmetsp:Transcript_15505/g.31356  ORF Transcript_15505/g.31356 Transcript_15505/m.31356 type:complete len:99 (-) Transcript_15505:11-307(-)